MLFASFSSLYHCVLCQSVVLPSCFLQKLQGCKSKIFSALRAPGLQKQNFLRAARARYQRKRVTQSDLTGDLDQRCKIFSALRAPVLQKQNFLCAARLFRFRFRLRFLLRFRFRFRFCIRFRFRFRLGFHFRFAFRRRFRFRIAKCFPSRIKSQMFSLTCSLLSCYQKNAIFLKLPRDFPETLPRLS